jgi:hypothetical protein
MSLTTKERADATKSLVDWFISQEINQSESAVIACNIVGIVVGCLAPSDEDLLEGCSHMHTLISLVTKNTRKKLTKAS